MPPRISSEAITSRSVTASAIKDHAAHGSEYGHRELRGGRDGRGQAGQERRTKSHSQRQTPARRRSRRARPPADGSRSLTDTAVEIPRLQLSGVVIEGNEDSAVKLAVGHLPDALLPMGKKEVRLLWSFGCGCRELILTTGGP